MHSTHALLEYTYLNTLLEYTRYTSVVAMSSDICVVKHAANVGGVTRHPLELYFTIHSALLHIIYFNTHATLVLY